MEQANHLARCAGVTPVTLLKAHIVNRMVGKESLCFVQSVVLIRPITRTSSLEETQRQFLLPADSQSLKQR
jgi:hypothetical protein